MKIRFHCVPAAVCLALAAAASFGVKTTDLDTEGGS